MKREKDKAANTRHWLVVVPACLCCIGFTVAAAVLNMPWLCTGSVACVIVAIVLDD